MRVLDVVGQALIPIIAITTLPAAVLAWIFVSPLAAGVVATVGWLFLVPVTAILYGVLTSTGRAHVDIDPDVAAATMDEIETEDPVEKLRQRYADGEIDEVELERGLDALLETEDVTTDDTEGIQRAVEHIDSDESGVTTSTATEVTGDSQTADERDVELDRN